MHGLSVIDLSSRQQVRVALACTLVKRAEDQPAFDAAFARWSAASRRREQPESPPVTAPATADGAAHSPPPTAAAEAIRGDLLAALSGMSSADGLEAIAARAAARWSGLGIVSGTERYHVQRVLRALALSDLAQDAVAARRDGADGTLAGLEARLARADVEALLDEFHRLLADEIRARMADATRRTAATDPREEALPRDLRDVDFLRASHRELRQMRLLVRPLARALAARLAQQQRRTQRGRLDMRHTLRASLGSGGVPIEPAYRHRRRTKPELWLLCDVSGSVAEFARFTLAFVCAMHEEFAGLRTFVFVDDIEEITDLLDRRVHDIDPFALLVRASSERRQRRSDYGQALDRFLASYGSTLSSRATVIIAGDARSHAADPGLDRLRAVRHRSRRVWFLNPEAQERWGAGDSAAIAYAGICDRMVEVRNLNQLADAVDELLI